MELEITSSRLSNLVSVGSFVAEPTREAVVFLAASDANPFVREDHRLCIHLMDLELLL